jgi:hypothetical protein
MRTFKPGDVVRIVGGPRAGETTTVVRGPYDAAGGHRNLRGDVWPSGSMVYELELSSINSPPLNVRALREWLEPYWEGKESSDQTLTAILDGVRGVKAKEREAAE